jgi:hypothetical protein
MKTAILSPPFPFIVLLKVVFMISEELELSSIAAYSAEKDAEENKEVEKRLVVVCTRSAYQWEIEKAFCSTRFL